MGERRGQGDRSRACAGGKGPGGAGARASVLKAPRHAGAVAVTEFFAPFAHVPGRYEWCRIRSPTHGVFDVFIVLGPSTADPATVYVRDDEGAAFMRERYPECDTFRVHADDLSIEEAREGRTVVGRLVSRDGPVRRAAMTFHGADAVPEEVPYGGDGAPVWGSRFTCTGVDLNVPAVVDGYVETADEDREDFHDAPAVVTLGSYGTLEERAEPQ